MHYCNVKHLSNVNKEMYTYGGIWPYVQYSLCLLFMKLEFLEIHHQICSFLEYSLEGMFKGKTRKTTDFFFSFVCLKKYISKSNKQKKKSFVVHVLVLVNNPNLLWCKSLFTILLECGSRMHKHTSLITHSLINTCFRSHYFLETVHLGDSKISLEDKDEAIEC